jgi:type II secretory pathway component GspD/PulD (secretin)
MSMNRLILRTFLAFALLPIGLAAHAQSSEANPSDCRQLPTRQEVSDCTVKRAQVKTIYLKNIVNQNDANEIMVAIRNSFDPGLKVYLLASQNALVVTSYPEELARVEALVQTLDRPHKTYRLNYTITELDAGKTVGTEHLSIVVVDGQHTTVKQGDKIPIATGSYSNGEATTTTSSGIQTQFTYLDVGMNFDSTVTDYDGGVFLKTKVEQSGLGQPSLIAGIQEPVVRQTVLEGFSLLTLGKPVMLGTIDVPNSTHHFDIAVVLEQIK